MLCIGTDYEELKTYFDSVFFLYPAPSICLLSHTHVPDQLEPTSKVDEWDGWAIHPEPETLSDTKSRTVC